MEGEIFSEIYTLISCSQNVNRFALEVIPHQRIDLLVSINQRFYLTVASEVKGLVNRMELTVGAWFSEPKINFKFSHKVDLYIRSQIKEHIMKPLGLLDLAQDVFLHLQVTTKKQQHDLEIILPPKNKRAKNKNYWLKIPYDEVIFSQYPLQAYISYYITSLKTVFKEWGVTEEQISVVRNNVEKEILNNPEYELTKEDLEELTFSERITDDIIKELEL